MEQFLEQTKEQAIDLLEKGKNILGDNIIIGARITEGFGFYDLDIKIREPQPNFGIEENSKVYMKFSLGLVEEHRSTYVINNEFQLQAIKINYHLKDAGLRYRKITGKNIEEVKNKFIKWLEKNSDLIKKVNSQ